jgi:hypothetical protein
VRTQLERLDARLATIERRAAPSAGRAPRPMAAARGRAPALLELPVDVLDKVVTCLAPDDELAASLACRKLRAALRAAARARLRRPPLQTRVRSLLGSLGRLQWGVACAGAPLSTQLFADVAGLGDLRMLSWLRARGCPWSDAAAIPYVVTLGPCARAAAGGHFAVLRWLRAVGCPWDVRTCTYAAGGGHLSVVQWARANGCPWEPDAGHLAIELGDWSLSSLVMHAGHASRRPWCAGTCAFAAKGGHLSVLQWAHAHGCPWDACTCVYAARGGHLSVLQCPRANGCPWDDRACFAAAESGQLQWLHANGCPWNAGTCATAALGGNLSVLQWARAHGCPWNANTCSCAADGGHLAVLQWAHANGCPWDQETCTRAAGSGHLSVLQWAHANG